MKNKKFIVGFLIGLLIFMVIAEMFWIYSEEIWSVEVANEQEKLDTAAVYAADTIELKFTDSISFVDNVTLMIEGHQDDDEYIASVLNRYVENSDFASLFYADSTGTVVSTGNDVFEVSDREYFKRAMQGETVVLGPVESRIDEKDMLVIAVPVIVDGEVVGCVCGAYRSDTFSELISASIFDGDGYIDVFGSDGGYIFRSGTEEDSVDTDTATRFLNSVTVLNQGNAAQIIDNITNGESGSFEYKADDGKWIASYVPVGVSDWYILATVPESVISENSMSVMSLTTLLAVGIALTFIIAIIAVVSRDRRANRELRAAYSELGSLGMNIPGGVMKCSIDELATIEYMNGGFETLLGYSRDELNSLVGSSFFSLVHEEDRERIRNEMTEQHARGLSIELEYRLATKDGSTIWVLHRGEEIQDENNAKALYSVMIDITDSKKNEQELRVSEQRYKLALEHSEFILSDFDLEERTLCFPQVFAERHGVKHIWDGIPGSLTEAGIIAENSREDFDAFWNAYSSGEHEASVIVKLSDEIENGAWVRIVLTPISSKDGAPVRAIGLIEDMTGQKEAEESFIKERQYRDAMLNDTLYCYEMNFTRDIVTKGVEGWKEDYGVEPPKSYTEMVDILSERVIHPDDVEKYRKLSSCENILAVFSGGQTEIDFEYRCATAKGDYVWMRALIHIVRDPYNHDVKGISYVKDIDSDKRASLEMKFKAERDLMSGLYNRVTVERLIDEFLESPEAFQSDGDIHAMLIFDIDDFKSVNDTFGHRCGDELIVSVGETITSVLRSTDIAGRIGGDEFVVLLKNIPNIKRVLRKADEMHDAVKDVVILNGSSNVSISSGIVLVPEGGKTFTELYHHADEALYSSKHAGKDRSTVYRPC